MHEDFDLAVDRLARSATDGVAERASGDDLSVVIDGLCRFVEATYPVLPRSEVADIVDEAIFAFTVAVAEGRVDLGRRPAAYLTTVARNEAVRRLRRVMPEPLEDQREPDGGGEEAAADFLDAISDQAAVEEALRAAAEEGDVIVVRVVACWLDLAETTGQTPSYRDVAREADVHHSTVADALDRFRSYLADS